jgi:Cu+-exporting ATPase
MVWGLAANLSEIIAFSTVYWVMHISLALASVFVVAMHGTELFREATSALVKRKLGIETLFAFSLSGAFLGSLYSTYSGEGDIYYEVVIVVMIIYSFGRKLGKVTKARALDQAQRFRKQFENAQVIDHQGNTQEFPVNQVKHEHLLVVYPGQPITMDGSIVQGKGFVKETPLTGEPHPVVKSMGDRIRAGTFSVDSTLFFKPTSVGEPRLIDEILTGVEASVGRSRSQREEQAMRWIEYFVILVATASLATGLVWFQLEGLQSAVLHSMAVLLIACPCALGIATPVGVWSGLWKITSIGLSSRSAKLVDILARTRHIFFDKTGTLTASELKVGSIKPIHPLLAQEAVLWIANRLESGIEHPVARAFTNPHYADQKHSVPNLTIDRPKWVQGSGVEAKCEWNRSAHTLRLGTPSWAEGKTSEADSSNKCLMLTLDHQPLAEIELTESLREGIEGTFASLRRMGIQITILTGDPHPAWEELSGARIVAGLTPDQKSRIVESSAEKGELPIYVGDGINDLNAMHACAASVSINDGGSLLTQSDSDAILVGKNLGPLPVAIDIAKKIENILQSNLKIAASYNIVGISLAAVGILHPVAAALVMIVSSLTVTSRAIGWTKF